MQLNPSGNPFGQATRPRSPGPQTTRQGIDAVQKTEFELGTAGNPLLAAANPLLNLAPQIRALTLHPDPDALHRQLVEEVRRFERQAQTLNIRTEEIIAARYCLCTALDESVALTPWGGTWAARSLLVTFHNEAWGGEKFFLLLSRLAADAQRHRNLLELQYYCLCLGFEGQYRIMEHGRSVLDTLKLRLLGILQGKQTQGGELSLSPHWQSGVKHAGSLRQSIPFWVYGSLTVLLLGIVFTGLLVALQGPSDRLAMAIGNVRLAKLDINTPTTTTLSEFLAPEISQRLLSVREEDDRSVIVIRGNGVFASGASQVKPSYLSVITRIGVALQNRKGPVEVRGYTDNQPIRFPFASNLELSAARASAVSDLLRIELGRERVSFKGMGEDHPITSNQTAEGRALNRRVEIILFKPGMSQEQG